MRTSHSLSTRESRQAMSSQQAPLASTQRAIHITLPCRFCGELTRKPPLNSLGCLSLKPRLGAATMVFLTKTCSLLIAATFGYLKERKLSRPHNLWGREKMLFGNGLLDYQRKNRLSPCRSVGRAFAGAHQNHRHLSPECCPFGSPIPSIQPPIPAL